MNNIIFAVLIIIIFSADIFPQSKYDNSDDSGFYPKFKNIQLDASSVYFSTKVGIAIDFQLFQNSSTNRIRNSTGIRFGADRIWKNTFTEPYYGTPFTHINGYVLFSVISKPVIIDTYIGGAYQFVSGETTDSKEGIIAKAGLDFKIKLFPYAGLLFNGAISTGESYVGFGIYLVTK